MHPASVRHLLGRQPDPALVDAGGKDQSDDFLVRAGRVGTLRPIPGDHIKGMIRAGREARPSHIANLIDFV